MKRISPVFDVSKNLLIADFASSTEVVRHWKALTEDDPVGRARLIKDLGIEVLICGAISKPLQLLLEAEGIKIVANVCGDIDAVLKAFWKGQLRDAAFVMPGVKSDSCEPGLLEKQSHPSR